MPNLRTIDQDGTDRRSVRAPKGCTVEALITHDGYADNLSARGVRVTRLPVFPKG